MKKLIGLLLGAMLTVVAAFSLTACGGDPAPDNGNGNDNQGAGAAEQYTVQSGKFIVATNCPFGMYEYIGDDGKIYGIDIEVAGLFAKENELELVVKNIEFDSIFSEVEAGKADAGMAGITVSEDRKKTFDFSDTYAKASQKLIVLDGNADFDGKTTAKAVEEALKGLSGKKIGFQTGTTGQMYINGDEGFGYDGFANIEGKGYDTAVTAIQDMKAGNIYAVVVDEGPASALVASIDGVKVIDVKLTDEDYAFLIKKGNAKLQEKFNAFLTKIKGDGTYAAIEAKYYEGKGEKTGYAVSTN